MNATDLLSSSAQVAVTLAGFAGVVVVFGSGAVHEWAAVDKFRLGLMLSTSAQALAYCMMALLLASADLSAPAVWAWSSGFVILLLLPSSIFSLRRFNAFSIDELTSAGASRPMFYAVSSVALATVALQLYNVLVARAFWPLFAAVVLSILSSLLQFIRLVMHRR